MKLPYMADQFEQMLKISNEFVRLQVSNEEYLCMKVLLLLSTGECQECVCVFLCLVSVCEYILKTFHINYNETGSLRLGSVK